MVVLCFFFPINTHNYKQNNPKLFGAKDACYSCLNRGGDWQVFFLHVAIVFAAFSISSACFSLSLCRFLPSSSIALLISCISIKSSSRLSSSIVQVFQILSPYIFARSATTLSSTSSSAFLFLATSRVSASAREMFSPITNRSMETDSLHKQVQQLSIHLE